MAASNIKSLQQKFELAAVEAASRLNPHRLPFNVKGGGRGEHKSQTSQAERAAASSSGFFSERLGQESANKYDILIESIESAARQLTPSHQIQRFNLGEQISFLEHCIHATSEAYKLLQDLNHLISSEAIDSGLEGDSEDEDLPEGSFMDVVPVSGEEAKELNDEVLARLQGMFGVDEEKLKATKAITFGYGQGKVHVEDFYIFLVNNIELQHLAPLVHDFARLLTHTRLRHELLKTHVKWTMNSSSTFLPPSPSPSAVQQSFQARSSLRLSKSRPESTISTSSSSFGDAELPHTLETEPINHLIFLIHGIGAHEDFQDENKLSWDGKAGYEGGNFSLRENLTKLMATHFKEVEFNLEIQSIEWHEELHTTSGVDDVYEMIRTEGSSSLREFTKDTIMDVLYYVSTTYGQIVINTVTEQLNSKYHTFRDEHPGFNGGVSIVCHSLGSVITYDLLTHERGQRGRNGVIFPGLDFNVEHMFAIGSPVAILTLSRGQLSFADGTYQGGFREPNAKYYYNINHPIDPIGYRVEPLFNPDLKEVPPVMLPQAKKTQHLGFAKMMEMMQEIAAPTKGMKAMQRIDYSVRLRVSEGVIEIVHALSSHSSYWESEDFALFILLSLCRPISENLKLYTAARLPPPKLVRRALPLTARSAVLGTDRVLLWDSCTWQWDNVLAIAEDAAIHFLKNTTKLAVKKRTSIPLRGSQVRLAEDNPLQFAILTPEKVHELRVGDVQSAREWVDVINAAIYAQKPEKIQLNRLSSLSMDPLLLANNGLSLDYFGCIREGFAVKKGKQQGWTSELSWRSRWIVLHEDRLDVFESFPVIDEFRQAKLKGSQVLGFPSSLLFRILTSTGSTTEMRVNDRLSYDNWEKLLKNNNFCNFSVREGVTEKSLPRLLLLRTQQAQKAMAKTSQLGTFRVLVEGYQIKKDQLDKDYVAFVVHTKADQGNFVVYRRHNEFKGFHHKLHEHIPNELLPPLPPTRLWNKFDPVYLRQKAAGLQDYAVKISKVCQEGDAAQLLVDFLTKQEIAFE